MKETKKFFDNNRLNKGYSRIRNVKQSDASLIRKKYQHVLPPIEVMEQYEELNPGAFEKLFDMADKEQNHRHTMDLLAIEKNRRDVRLGRVFALCFVAMIAISTLLLVVLGNAISASVFAMSAFACIAIVSYFFSRTIVNKSPVYNKSNNRSRSYKNYNSSSRNHKK